MRIVCKHCGKEVVQLPMIEVQGNWICLECISDRKPDVQQTDPTYRIGTEMTWKLCIPTDRSSSTDNK